MRVANALIATLQDAMIEQGLEPVDALKACLLAGGLVASGCRPADAKEIRDVATAVVVRGRRGVRRNSALGH
jgi:ribosomal protein L14